MTSNKNASFYKRRKDSNHKDITRVLNRASYPTWDTHKQAEGFPDFLCLSKTFIPVLFEVKNIGEGLTPLEIKFHDTYKGPLAIIETPEHALQVMELFDGVQMSTPTYFNINHVVIREICRVERG